MNEFEFDRDRRTLIKGLMAMGLSGPWVSSALFASVDQKIQKAIPSSGERIPVIGLGTSRTFDALGHPVQIQQLQAVLQSFFSYGGAMIDSSPMYGTSQDVIGSLLEQVKSKDNLFAATKVWTTGQDDGIVQIEESRQLWGIDRFDLMQIHNLVDWQTHLQTINKMKSEDRLRYTGITTSHGRNHDELAEVLKQHAFDFVQFSYNIGNREVEKQLLPIAADRGIAVIINRPYQRGDLFQRVKGKPLPDWASEIDVKSWGQFFLKFIVSHPAVTCAIPATSKTKHMVDNMGAQFGRLPDEKMREEMIWYYELLG